ncbi:hypothetical protein CQ020_03625 [Arthrobacter sp. MYb23]|uniref:hypothetical protein n=1 Tax=unclassified Arthrobacter TaxID=235627 RepID=UPI000CFB3B61|nr:MULTISPECIES: hypothetical protein [unclassified Arthrobacter]PRB44310.1 hypothetical protein CQ038_03480 [Arthrobacter sp. MYb51]PRB98562.1 hypothetical protein CQ020_03625 [Arthrobacter sp. MYb23]
MSDERRRISALGLNPDLEHLQLPASTLCWWCGDAATTEEHRIKASTLRRVARLDDGTHAPRNVYKKSSDYAGPLRSLNKGTQVRWRKNLCGDCNSSKSQPFDRSHDAFETFLVDHINVLSSWEHLDWQLVYGADWQEQSRNLARYFGKQLGCMLASHQLRVPTELIQFLDGSDRCPSVSFMLCINPRAIALHERMLADGDEHGLSGFVGLLDSSAYQTDGIFTGIDYGYHIGYLWFVARWRAGSDISSWFEYQVIDLPRLSSEETPN